MPEFTEFEKKEPRHERGIGEERIRRATRGNLPEPRKHQREHGHRGQRLRDGPARAEERLAVAALDLTPREIHEQLPVRRGGDAFGLVGQDGQGSPSLFSKITTRLRGDATCIRSRVRLSAACRAHHHPAQHRRPVDPGDRPDRPRSSHSGFTPAAPRPAWRRRRRHELPAAAGQRRALRQHAVPADRAARRSPYAAAALPRAAIAAARDRAHAHGQGRAARPAAAAAYNATRGAAPRARIVHTYHGHVLEGYFSARVNRIFIALERLLARTSDASSPSRRRSAASWSRAIASAATGNTASCRSASISSGFAAIDDADRAAARRALNLADGAPVIATVGRLTAIKQHELFLDAVRRRRAATSGGRCLIAGDGELRAELEALAATLGIGDRVRFLGWRRDLATIYAATDVFLLTSRNEGTPVALIEAMASAVPGVSTDVGGVEDVIAFARRRPAGAVWRRRGAGRRRSARCWPTRPAARDGRARPRGACCSASASIDWSATSPPLSASCSIVSDARAAADGSLMIVGGMRRSALSAIGLVAIAARRLLHRVSPARLGHGLDRSGGLPASRRRARGDRTLHALPRLAGVRAEVIRTPGYPAFVAVFYRLFGMGNDTAVAAAQVLIFALLCLLVYALTRRLAERAHARGCGRDDRALPADPVFRGRSS